MMDFFEEDGLLLLAEFHQFIVFHLQFVEETVPISQFLLQGLDLSHVLLQNWDVLF